MDEFDPLRRVAYAVTHGWELDEGTVTALQNALDPDAGVHLRRQLVNGLYDRGMISYALRLRCLSELRRPPEDAAAEVPADA